jgi:hypothetical protein
MNSEKKSAGKRQTLSADILSLLAGAVVLVGSALLGNLLLPKLTKSLNVIERILAYSALGMGLVGFITLGISKRASSGDPSGRADEKQPESQSRQRYRFVALFLLMASIVFTVLFLII